MLTVEEQVVCDNLLRQSGCGSEPDLQPSLEFRPVANTSDGCRHRVPDKLIDSCSAQVVLDAPVR